MQDRIKTVMAQIFNVDIGAITDESSPENIERWDSLRHMQLVLALEDEFGVTFSDGDIPELLSLRAIEKSVGILAR
ncbi:MAG: acyl carrier protein [Gammaproteobacteria bacterium]|nr:acyl carrier protein [Gammaproteobacteria bacterium]MDH3372275.1 acyl carrier protein [Gammaproteobacteria bacterium]MDH3409124.1 acyl carrier protein [Gammaproteobacteria bacterium]MDH3553317.1 acyl carrier protein [Gammaproteobacteria bacterium]